MRGSLGFDDRIFLTEAEWRTYLRRAPVRYIRKAHDSICWLCGGGQVNPTPLQHCHRIPFLMGVKTLGLTPDYLDRPANIVSAHRNVCNSGVELDVDGCLERLWQEGIREIPAFLDDGTHDAWARVRR